MGDDYDYEKEYMLEKC